MARERVGRGHVHLQGFDPLLRGDVFERLEVLEESRAVHQAIQTSELAFECGGEFTVILPGCTREIERVERGRRPASLLDLVVHRFEFLDRLAEQNDRRAVARAGEGQGLAQAITRTGDE